MKTEHAASFSLINAVLLTLLLVLLKQLVITEELYKLPDIASRCTVEHGTTYICDNYFAVEVAVRFDVFGERLPSTQMAQVRPAPIFTASLTTVTELLTYRVPV